MLYSTKQGECAHLAGAHLSYNMWPLFAGTGSMQKNRSSSPYDPQPGLLQFNDL